MNYLKKFIVAAGAFIALVAVLIIALPQRLQPEDEAIYAPHAYDEIAEEAPIETLGDRSIVYRSHFETHDFFEKMVFGIGNPYVSIDERLVLINEESRVTPMLVDGVPMLPKCILAEIAGAKHDYAMIYINDLPYYWGFEAFFNPASLRINVVRPFQTMRLSASTAKNTMKDFSGIGAVYVDHRSLHFHDGGYERFGLYFETVAETIAAYKQLLPLVGTELTWLGPSRYHRWGIGIRAWLPPTSAEKYELAGVKYIPSNYEAFDWHQNRFEFARVYKSHALPYGRYCTQLLSLIYETCREYFFTQMDLSPNFAYVFVATYYTCQVG